MEFIENYDTLIVGTIALKTQEDVTNRQPISTIKLKRMSVSSNFRGKGIGRKLLAHAVDEASALSYNRIILVCTEMQMPAISMYLTHGFITTRIINKPLMFVLLGINIHYMEKKL
ncbi:N-acetylaspartate synthetase-like [Styela clava]